MIPIVLAACLIPVTAPASAPDRERRAKAAIALTAPACPPPVADTVRDRKAAEALAAAAAPKAVVWRADYAEAVADAERAGKPVVTLVTQDAACAACVVFERGTLGDAGVREQLAGVVAVRVDAAADPKFAASLRVTVTPTVIVADKHGTILRRLVSPTAADLVAAVKAAGQ